MAQRTSFVGREAERAELDAQWRLAAGGSFRCALVVGEPGVGKTRLADEAG
ncbi:MAG: ATP-binding protein, partial [Acidimicrobiia bacterium]